MEVELYVYDLSAGMARQYSRALTGIQLDAIYHTAVVFNNVEYFFGNGIHRKIPGSTHHGRPMSIVKLGKTDLPLDVIEEYIQSLESIYTPESYDLFLHNCNNFTQDLSIFLVGKSIPDDIRTLPETFLQTPIGQMLRSQIDQSMRKMTQAPDAVAGRNVGLAKSKHPQTSSNGTEKVSLSPQPITFINAKSQNSVPGRVYNITQTHELDKLLRRAESSCAVIFFTSATCPPCKLVYPAYDQLAEEAGNKATLIKVDVSQAYEVGMRYSIRATPTFISFLRGKKDDEWSGANEAKLRGNVRLLVQMAHPQHHHTRLRLPTLQRVIQAPAMYTKTPPLDKLLAKIGATANDEAIQDVVRYIKARHTGGMINAPIPNLHRLSAYMSTSFQSLPKEAHFAIVDLIRIASTDPRVSNVLVTEDGIHTLSKVLPIDRDYSAEAYNLQVVTLQLGCNLFSSNIFQELILNSSNQLRTAIEHLASSCLLASQSNARSLAAALVYNLAAIDHNERIEGRADRMNIGSSADLEAALVQAVINEESKETLHGLLLALGILLYGAPTDSSIWDLCGAMEVRSALLEKQKNKDLSSEPLLIEVGLELLAKGGT